MIHSINIQNFQSHKKTELEFCDGVNIIVGPSDSGKTAILRALNWLVNNRPMGDAFRSEWGGRTIVQLEMDTGLTIDRMKSDKEVTYTLSPDGDEIVDIEFKAAGRDVPEEIKEVLNLDPINLQFQLDGPFLLSKSAGEVAKYLNQVIKLDSIDNSLSAVNKRIRNQTAEITNLQSNLTNLKNELEEYDWLKEAELKLVGLEALDQQIKKGSATKEFLEQTLTQIESVNEKIEEVEWLVNMEEEVDVLSRVVEEIEQDKKQLTKLYSLISDIDGWIVSIENEKNVIKNLEKEYEELMPDTCPLCGRGD